MLTLAPMTSRDDPAPRSRGWLVLGAVLLVGVGGAAFYLLHDPPLPGGVELRRELRDRGRVAVIGDRSLVGLEAEGAQLLAGDEIDGLAAALAAEDEGALADVLQREAIGAVLVDRRGAGDGAAMEGGSVGERLRAYARVESLRGVYLTPVAGLYERRRGLEIEDDLGAALARAARQIVGGARTPSLRAFPEPLRRNRNVEVLVMLERDGRPRLWRSARGSSIARALITAASVARQRWTERERAMGAPIDDPFRGLPSLTVRVYLLEEDGTLGDRSRGFLERVFGPSHGVAFEDRGSWHYLLPQATEERGEGSIMLAYAELFEDAGLGPRPDGDAGPPDPEASDAQRRERLIRSASEILARDDLRFYRLVAREVGVSAPSPSPTPSPSGPDVAPPPINGSEALLAPLDLDSL